MGKSFVMKRPDGSLAGYLMQESDGRTCFRAHALPEEGASLTLVFRNGAQASRAVSGEREAAWTERSGDVEAAFVAKEGKLLMSTGERGRKAYEAALEHDEARRRAAKRREQDTAAGKPADMQEKASDEAPEKEPERAKPALCEEKSVPQTVPNVHVLPERRWPPPPCMPGASYEEGRWQA